MKSFIEPNIHPILVHFAFALSITSVICYLLSGFQLVGNRKESLRIAADWMLAFAGLAIVATIAAGFQAYYSVAHDGPSHAAMTTHRNWAVPSGTAILLLALWRWSGRTKPASALFKTLLTAAAISLSVTAWWGGHIVYNYGLGVKSLPVVTGDGHDHDHGNAEVMPVDSAAHDAADGHHEESKQGHDNSDGHHDTDSSDVNIVPLADGTPEAVVNAFGVALKSGDTETFRSLMVEDVIIAEGGAAERSFEEYASHHMPADIAFIGAVETTLKKRNVISGTDLTTVISQSQIHGTYKDQKIHSQMMETMVLRQTETGWRITHIHWSSAPIKGEHDH